MSTEGADQSGQQEPSTDALVLEAAPYVGPSLAVAPPRVDEARLRAIVDQHFHVLWRFLRRLGIPEGDVDDAVQEVVLVLARRLASVRQGSERSFVLGTAFRVASELRREVRRRREAGDAPLATLAEQSADPEALAERRRARALLDRLLGELPLELRAVFVLYELEGMTMAEIAVNLTLAPGTVASRLRRARQEFQARVTALDLARGEDP